MQLERVLGILLATVIVHGRAAPVLSLRGRASSASHGSTALVARDMPVTSHDKDAGAGYQPGSPLYEKQQALGKTKKPPAAPTAELKAPTVEVPQDQKSAEKQMNEYAKLVQGPEFGTKAYFMQGFTYFFETMILYLLAALIWVKCIGRHKIGYKERERYPHGFSYGLFSLDHCFGHHNQVCLCSWFCSPLRLADTYSKEPHSLIPNFWGALVGITFLVGVEQLTRGLSLVVLLCGAIYFRQQLRKAYSLPSGGVTVLEDCAVWCCCPCCATAQEARQVEFVMPKDVAPESIKTGAYAPGSQPYSQKSFSGF